MDLSDESKSDTNLKHHAPYKYTVDLACDSLFYLL